MPRTRTASIERKTNETQIRLRLNLDGRGSSKISTGIRFFDHMLDLVARHGAFDLTVEAKGDLDVDQHHTVEDTGIVIGQLFAKALGDRKGINRAGYFVLPMDETLAVVAIEASIVDVNKRNRPCTRRQGVQARIGSASGEPHGDANGESAVRFAQL